MAGEEGSLDTYIIREMIHADIEPLLELGSVLHLEGNSKNAPYNREKCRELGMTIISDPNRYNYNCMVAEYKGKAIGMYVATISTFWFNDDRICTDIFFYVDPAYRNRWPMMPIRMIKRAIGWAKSKNAVVFFRVQQVKYPGCTIDYQNCLNL
jgi:GNAT superfamily N-acetyltransferase